MNEEKIISEIKQTFGISDENIRVARARRIFMEVPEEKFIPLINHLFRRMDFKRLASLTGQDEGETMTVYYHLSRFDGTMLNLKRRVPKNNPVLSSIQEWFPGGVIYEREIKDLLGFIINNLPEGERYPLPDGWPDGQHPLRKDWDKSVLDKAWDKGSF